MKKLFAILILSICLLLAGILSSCQKVESTPATATPTATSTPMPTPTPLPERMGAQLDNIYMFEAIPSQASKQVMDGALDIYANSLSIDQIATLQGSNILYEPTVNRQYELLLNPADTTSKTGLINPFSFTEIRSAINILLDRQYISEKIFSGGAVAKYQPLVYKSSDYNIAEPAINELALQYTYDFDKASEIITQVLLDNGCKLDEEGNWIYKKELVSINILIRNDDALRTQIGDYTADQLESLGFTVTRQYVSQSEASTIWAAGDPTEGLWHIYTGRRSFDSVNLNQENIFADNYSDFGKNSEIELYKYFTTNEDFTLDASTLLNGQYSSIEQRSELVSRLVSTCNDYSFRIWLVDEFSYSPYSEKVEFTNTLTTQPSIDYATVYTLKKTDMWGGELNWGTNSLLNEIVNPVNGSTSPSETQYLNFSNLPLVYENSDTGKISSAFINNVKMTYLDSINYVNDIDWISVDTADEIKVPTDAIISWNEERDAPVYADAQYMNDVTGLATAWLATYEREKPRDREKIKNQQAVVEAFFAIETRGYLTANVKYVVEYNESIFDLTWHDGSSFSVADLIMAFITKTQLMDEKSSLYDEYYAQQHEGELDNFKCFKVVSESPLIIEYYTDDYSHLTSQTIDPLWIDYGSGQQSWAMAAAANEAVKNKTASYSEGLSLYYGYDLLNYTDKESLSTISEQLSSLKNKSYIPYAELLAPYVTPTVAKSQYKSILDFYENYKHMQIGVGPYMITNVDLLSPSLTLSAFSDFPLKADDLAKVLK